MNAWLSRLLGLDPRQDALRPDQVFFVHPWPLAAAVAAVVALALWVAFFYARDGTRPAWPWKALLAALRVGAVAVLLLLLWQPVLRGHRSQTTPSVVAVLLDESRSMALEDRWEDRRRAADLQRALGAGATSLSRAESAARLLNQNDAALLRALAERHQVRIYRFGEEVRGAELRLPGTAPATRPVSPTTPAGETVPLRLRPAAEQTRLGDALDFVLQDTAGQPLAGAVLFSDGGSNLGEDPAVAARRAGDAGMPIFAVGLGDPTPPRDVAVTGVLTDEVVRKGDEVIVSISLRHRGYAGRQVPLLLKLDDRVVRQERVTLAADSDRQEVHLPFTPESPGARTLTVTVPGQPGEITLGNNRRAWPVRIIDKKLRILYVEGRPRWEYRFLKNAILRDPSTLFSCLLADADPALGGEGNVPLYGFPREKKALLEYDILILGDVPRDFFTAVDLQNIRAFVEERGGSLICMAGELFMPWQYRGTELDAVLPIVVPPTRRDVLFREPFQLELTEAGARNPMLFLVPKPEENRALWHSLPGMYWCAVAERARPGATVLTQHPGLTGPEGKLPLMALQQVGEGSVFMTMVDSTWQWRYRVGDKYFYRFWGQVVRSLTPHELPGANRFVRLSADRTTYTLGERVALRARLLTPSYHPLRLPGVTATLERTDGQRFPVPLDPVPGAAGIYTGEWLPPLPGAYRAVLRGPSGQQGESITNIVVETSSLELEAPQQHEAVLRRVSALSGGRYLLPSEVADLPRSIPDRSQEVRTRIEHELWDAPLGLVVFALLLIGEWALRKRHGLL